MITAILAAALAPDIPQPHRCNFYVADIQYTSDSYTAAYRDRVKIWLRLDPLKNESTVFVLDRPDLTDPTSAARYSISVTAYLALLTRALNRTDIGVEPQIEHAQTGIGTESNPYLLGSLSMATGSLGHCYPPIPDAKSKP